MIFMKRVIASLVYILAKGRQFKIVPTKRLPFHSFPKTAALKAAAMAAIGIAAITTATAMSSATSYAGQWQQDSGGRWYEEDDGTYPAGTWKWIKGRYYYFDGRGYMLSDTTTPDGYQVGADGAFLPGPGQSVDEVGGIRCGDEDAVITMWMNNEGRPMYQNEIHHDMECYVMDREVDCFMFPSGESNLSLDAHEVWLYGVTAIDGKGVVLGEIHMMPFEYDRIYSFDFTGNNDSAEGLSRYCIDNDVTITIDLVDKTGYSILTGYPASVWRYRYATASSIPAAGM